MRIVFIGCVLSSYVELKLLIDNGYEIAGVITKAQSNFNSDFCDLSPLAAEHGIPAICVKNINDEDSVTFIRKCAPDVMYCFGWSQLIRKEILELAPLGVIGTHPAELPKNRGRHPIIWALVLGLKQTAASLFRMDENADTGELMAQEMIPIFYEDDANDLYKRIEEAECRLILELTKQLEEGTLVPIPQTEEGNTWRKRGRADGLIDWRMSSRAIYNLVRALSKPYPGAEFLYQDVHYTVWKAEEVLTDQYENYEPGKVLRVVSDTEFYVKVYDNVIHVMDCTPVSMTEGDYL